MPPSKLSAVLICMSALVASPAIAQQPNEVESRLAELEDRMDTVEKKSLLDRVNLTGEFRTIFNFFHYKSEAFSQTTEEMWTMRLRLNFKAEPVDSVRVTARLTMYKIFGDADEQAFIPDFEQSRLPRRTEGRFDQAWIDWFITEWVALSAGRIAYGGGPPEDLYNNAPVRQATWGTHLVDGEYDTVNMTFNLSNVLPDLRFRLFYASYFFDDDNGIPFLDNGTDNLRAFGTDLELKIPGMGRNFFQIGYIIIPKWTLFPAGINDPFFDASADFNNAPSPLSQGIIFPSAKPDTLGTWQLLAAILMFYDLMGSGVDVFVSGSVGFNTSSNKGVEYEIPEDQSNPNSQRRSTPLIFLAGTGVKDTVVTGFLYGGVRYTLPVEAINNPKIGVEFNWASRYQISLQQTTDRLIPKLEIRGKVLEGYYIQPINKALFVRLGYLFMDRDWDDNGSSFVGRNVGVPGTESVGRRDEIVHNLHLTLQATL